MSRWTAGRETEPVSAWGPTTAPWIGRMRWSDVLFLHWPVDPAQLAPHVPDGVALDINEGSAWVSATALTMRRAGVRMLPPLPQMAELNVRTYATADGKPGVVFLALHASNPLLVAAGRAVGLPYEPAGTVMEREGRRRRFASQAGDASMAASYTPHPGPLDDALHRVLTARYCLYTTRKDRTLRIDVRHAPWPLQPVAVESWSSGLGRWGIDGPPHLAAFSPGVDVVVAPPCQVGRAPGSRR